ncbi:MAG: helical backbone metal receptor [Pseudomonadota bacterium]|jgi:iron complex transport system substrate-binding protein
MVSRHALGWCKVWWVVLLAWGWALAGAAQPIHLLDDRGQTLRLSAPAQRVVSLLPSLTESVCALGQCQRLVGVDRYSNWPAQVTALARVGGGIDPNLEAIVALRPDLVLASTATRGLERLPALGVPVLALRTDTWADAQQALVRVGQALGLPPQQALGLWQQVEAEVGALAQALPPQARGARVYFEVNPAPFAAGPASFIGQTLTRLGAGNIVPPEMGPFPQLNPEFVVRADPDLIIVADFGLADLGARPGWQRLRALREQRVCVLSPAAADLVVRPGPRLAEGARHLAACLARLAPLARQP